MKNIFKSLVFLLISYSLNAQIVNIPDANFKAALIAHGVDTNTDGDIQNTEALAITNLYVSNSNISDITGILSFTNLTIFHCNDNQISFIDVSGLSQLTTLFCFNNLISSLTISGCTNLTYLYSNNNQLTSFDCSGNVNITEVVLNDNPSLTTLNTAGCSNLSNLNIDEGLTNVNISNCPLITNFTMSGLSTLNVTGCSGLQILFCNGGNLTSLDLTGCSSLITVQCSNNQITSLNSSGLINLQNLLCANNLITSSIDFSNNENLLLFDCENNLIPSINVSGCTSLNYFNALYNPQLLNLNVSNCFSLTTNQFVFDTSALVTLNVSNYSSLTLFVISAPFLQNINVSGCSSLITLALYDTQLTSLDVSGLSNLTTLVCFNAQLTSLDVSGLSNLNYLDCSGNQITGDLDVSGFLNLAELYCNGNQMSSINASNCTNLEFFDFTFNPLLTSVNLSGCSSLQYMGSIDSGITSSLITLNVSNTPLINLVFDFPQLQSLNVSGCNNLTIIGDLSGNQVTSLDVSGLTNLTTLVYDGQLNTINLENCINLSDVQLANNQLTSIDVSTLPALTNLDLNGNQISTLDVNANFNLQVLTIDNNPITHLYAKNGADESIGFSNNPNLIFVCVDESQVVDVHNNLNNAGLTSTVCNSYCSFTPGGDYNTIIGNLKLDSGNNGCDNQDIVLSNVRVNVNDGTTTSAVFTNNNGQYNRYVLTGNYIIEPIIENSAAFNISPLNASVNFPNNINNLFTQDFCFMALPLYIDLEVVIMTITPARPGFDAKYRLVYKNKGNTTIYGTIAFNYNDSVLDFVSSSQIPMSQSFGMLNWGFSNFLPLESRFIDITLNVNSPVETPAVNIGDILNYEVQITSQFPDSNPQDDVFNYEQTVVGAYDPNNIECLEGEVVSPSYIGQYLHYGVNFENTGNFPAENVVVKIEIDTTKYNINSLQLLNTSHNSYTKITGNIVEFIFENIALDSGGHGNVLFKIQTTNSLISGDMVAKRGDIYFDYNAPIDTGMANTTFETLNNTVFIIDNSITIYPNPTKGLVNIISDFNIKTIELYDVQGRLLQTQIINESSLTVDLSQQSNGIYFVKINSDKGSKVEKIVKE